MSATGLEIFLGGFGGATFDPAARAELSPEQRQRLEQFMIGIRMLKDGQGLRILFNMDTWLCAQMVAALFNADGSAKSMQDMHEHLHSNRFGD